MIFFNTYISESVFCFFKNKKNILVSVEDANKYLQEQCGIKAFFENDSELLQLTNKLNEQFTNEVCESDAEYGDFQTN